MEIFKLSSQKLVIGYLFLFLIGGCSLFNPYIDRRRNPGVADIKRLYSGPSTPDKPVICYNGWVSDDEELQALADAECVKQETGNKAKFVEKTYFDGKLLLPHHAHYQCIKE
jgi:hypothetical protein